MVSKINMKRKGLSKDYCLATVNPKLAKEWHPTNNGPLTPHNVVPMSHKKVWWQCNKGHEWQSIISNRSNLGRGCPYCTNQKVFKDNCLATVNPKLAKEWHPTKNNKLTPSDVTPGSSRKKVWWLCDKGHEWEASVKTRSNGYACPYCASQKVCNDNCLATINPELAKEWHPTKNATLTPNDVTKNSGKKVWWLCKKGHEWQATIDNRFKDRGCPYCSNKKVCSDNCLATVNPKLAKEWHPTKNGKLTPLDVVPGFNKKVWWQCKKEHEWQAVLNSRSAGRNCPYCNSQTSMIELRIYAELKYIFPDTRLREKIQKVECDVYIPSLKVGVEHDGEYWHRNKQKKDLIKNITLKKIGVKLIRVRELGLDKISEDDIIYNPNKVDAKLLVDKLVKKIDSLVRLSSDDHTRVDLYLKRAELVNNKEFLSLLDMLPSPFPESSFAYHKPELAKEWHPTKNGKLTPFDVTTKSNKRVWWLCEKGHEWETLVQSRFIGHGCPYCSSRFAGKDNNLQVLNPELAKEWHPTKNGAMTPLDVSPGSDKKVWWKCKKGHEWQASVYNRNKFSRGCPVCSSLAIKNPKLAKEWHPTKNGKLTPFDVTTGTHKKVWWKCPIGDNHEWEREIADRVRGNGCPYCSGRYTSKETSLATTNPQLAREWHPTKNGTLTPFDVRAGSWKEVWWLCEKGHEWQAVIRNKTRSKGIGCPKCRKEKIKTNLKQKKKNSGQLDLF